MTIQGIFTTANLIFIVAMAGNRFLGRTHNPPPPPRDGNGDVHSYVAGATATASGNNTTAIANGGNATAGGGDASVNVTVYPPTPRERE